MNGGQMTLEAVGLKLDVLARRLDEFGVVLKRIDEDLRGNSGPGLKEKVRDLEDWRGRVVKRTAVAASLIAGTAGSAVSAVLWFVLRGM